MFLYRLAAMARKEFHHVTRDARALFLVTVAPAFLLFTLAYVFSMDADHFSVLVWDQDRSDLSRRYVAELADDQTFTIVGYASSQQELDEALKRGRAHVALIIPPGAADAWRARRSAPVQALVDGVDAIAASQTVGQLTARNTVFAQSLLPPTARQGGGTLDVRNRAWYNPPLKSLNSMVPGLMALVLVMPALALSLSLTREKELGSFEGLAATPIRGLEYLLGKLLTYIGFGLVSTLPMVAVAVFWFRVPFHGSPLTFLVLATCYLFASCCLSVLIANFARSQQTAMMTVILVFFVPSFFLAGLIMPVDASSPFSVVTSTVLPATHFIVICRGVLLKGLGVASLAPPALTLLAMGSVSFVSGWLLFRKRIA